MEKNEMILQLKLHMQEKTKRHEQNEIFLRGSYGIAKSFERLISALFWSCKN